MAKIFNIWSPLSFANYLIKTSRSYAGDGWEQYFSISNLKLQNLLFFAYGIYYVYFNDELFELDDDNEQASFVASSAGPAIPYVYKYYAKKYKNPVVTIKDFVDDGEYFGGNPILFSWFKEFWKELGGIPAKVLKDMSQVDNGVWSKIYVKGQSKIMPKKAIQDYFMKWVVKKADKTTGDVSYGFSFE